MCTFLVSICTVFSEYKQSTATCFSQHCIVLVIESNQSINQPTLISLPILFWSITDAELCPLCGDFTDCQDCTESGVCEWNSTRLLCVTRGLGPRPVEIVTDTQSCPSYCHQLVYSVLLGLWLDLCWVFTPFIQLLSKKRMAKYWGNMHFW